MNFDFEVNFYCLIFFNHVIAVSNFEVKLMLNKIPTNNLVFELDRSVFKIYFLWAKTFQFSEDWETTSFNVIHMFFYFYVVLLSFSCHHLGQW